MDGNEFGVVEKSEKKRARTLANGPSNFRASGCGTRVGVILSHLRRLVGFPLSTHHLRHRLASVAPPALGIMKGKTATLNDLPGLLRARGCGNREENANPRAQSGVTVPRVVGWAWLLMLVAMVGLGCKSETPKKAEPPFMSAVAGDGTATAEQAQVPEADRMGGFDGHRAYELVEKQVSFGPRPAGSAELAKLQEYMVTELKSYGCAVETDDFSADTPAGRLPMKNILVKIPGAQPGIILLGTHYDTKKLPDFVGADDGGSSTAVMMEVARDLCGKQPGKYAVWIAFFDGEEAVNLQWKDPDNRYGSRQMAAKFAASGDIPKIKAFILVDLVGGRNILFKKETDSTKWLKDQVWRTAADLGYGNYFVNSDFEVSDDHLSFLSRNVPAVDIVDLTNSAGYWHTPQDTMDKISAKSLAIVGHVVLESVKQLQMR